ncbi:MAG: hypothetical protein FJ030_09540 [Chloroflexi bacterium]|nr:hypothetical protein [Chloroflexota bacterium]
MTILAVSPKSKTVNDLLKKAKRKNLVLESPDGDRYVLCRISEAVSFYVGDDDDFAKEVEKTRKNKKLMKYLDQRREKSRREKRIPIEQVRRELGL